jgi:hypothetical protein
MTIWPEESEIKDAFKQKKTDKEDLSNKLDLNS